MLDPNRRECISLLGVAAGWPLAARAQQAAMPVVGMLRSTRAEGFANLTEALRAGLSQGCVINSGRDLVLS
jgi:putative ABC transport system substrate-binding protein